MKSPAAVESLTARLKQTINVEKTRCCRTPEEPFEFLGYRTGRNYRPGTDPSRASVQSICRKISELTERRYGAEVMVRRLNRLMLG